jgi:hypothetical protein
MDDLEELIGDFNLLTEIAYDLSQQFDGVTTDCKRRRLSTYFLAKTVPGCMSLLKILPTESQIYNEEIYLDFSSISSLSRNLIEATNLHWYYCVDEVNEGEIDFRFLLYDYHDSVTLLKIFQSLEFTLEDIEQLESERDILKEGLKKHPHFTSLENDMKRNVVKGRKSSILSQVEIAEKRGLNVGEFNGIYKLLSNHVHTTPSSIKSVVYSRAHTKEMDLTFTGLILTYVASLLANMILTIGEMWGIEFAKVESRDIVLRYSDEFI